MTEDREDLGDDHLQFDERFTAMNNALGEALRIIGKAEWSGLVEGSEATRDEISGIRSYFALLVCNADTEELDPSLHAFLGDVEGRLAAVEGRVSAIIEALLAMGVLISWPRSAA